LSKVGRLPSRTYLRKVVYERIEQQKLVTEVVQSWIRTAHSLLQEEGTDPKDLFPYPAIWALQEALAEHHLCFKDPAFSEEHEWRLIKLVNVREELRLLDDRRLEAMMAAIHELTRELGIAEAATVPPRIQRDAEGIEIAFRQSSIGLVPYVELPLIDPAGVFTGRLPL
jgi:hypothetical protein